MERTVSAPRIFAVIDTVRLTPPSGERELFMKRKDKLTNHRCSPSTAHLSNKGKGVSRSKPSANGNGRKIPPGLVAVMTKTVNDWVQETFPLEGAIKARKELGILIRNPRARFARPGSTVERTNPKPASFVPKVFLRPPGVCLLGATSVHPARCY